jgi:antitoxin ParD1/3/4
MWCIITPVKTIPMRRLSITFTEPNDEWLKNQVVNKEYASKSELINDLIRQARKQQKQVDWMRIKLEQAEKNGFTEDSKEDILKQSKALLS